ARRRVVKNERTVYQRGQEFENVPRCVLSGRQMKRFGAPHLRLSTAIADGFRRFQRPAARKDRQTLKEYLFGKGEQVVTPVHRGVQGLMTRYNRLTATRQQPKTVFQSRRDLLRRQ